MSVQQHATTFISTVQESLGDQTFVKLSLGNYKGEEEALKQILIRRVTIKREDKLAFTFRYKTRDVVKNYLVPEGLTLITRYLNTGFKIATLFSTQKDLILEELNNGKVVLRESTASSTVAPSASHDKAKNRLIKPESKTYP